MWILFALTSATILASRKIQEKKLVSSIWWVMWWMIRVGSVVTAFLIWWIFSRSIDGILTPSIWWILLYCFFAYPLLIVFYYKAMEHLPLSLFGMLAPIVPVASLLGTWVIYDTIPSMGGFIWLWAISIGIITLFWRHENKEISILSLIFAVFSYVIIWFGSVLDKIAIGQVSSSLYTLLNQMTALTSLFLFSFLYFRWPHIHFYKKNFKILTFIGITQGIGYLWGMIAISLSPNPWYVVALVNTHAIITALYGVFILKEKITRKKVFVFLCMFIALISFAFA